MTNIKYKRAKAASKWGVHNLAFNHIWSLIPDVMLKKLSGKELGLVIDEYHQKVFSLGAQKKLSDLCEIHGCTTSELYSGMLIKKEPVTAP